MLGDPGEAFGLMNIDPRTRYADLTTLLSPELGSLDYPSLFKIGRAIFFGECHSLSAPKEETIRNMGLFRQAGVTHLAMEMIPQSKQAVMDRYYRVGDNQDILLAHLRGNWGYGPGIPEKYLLMIDAAKSSGIKVVGVDIDLSEDDPRRKEDQIADQNENWASIIYDVLHMNREAKVLVYCGSAHLGYSQFTSKVNTDLARKGLFSTVVKFIGGNSHVPPLDICVGLDEHLQRAVIDKGFGSRHFAIAVKPTADRSADCYVHLPDS